MTEVDCYVLPASDPEARALFLCRFSQKLMRLGQQAFVYCDTQSEAEHLDQLLWEFKPEAFVPHSLCSDPTEAPIRLGWGDLRADHQQVFINMALAIPEDALSYDRLVEIIVQEPGILQATRENYRHYKAQGIEPRMHDMR